MKSLDRARELYNKRLKTPVRVNPALERLQADVGGAGAAKADLVIEAIYENLDAKQALYAQVESTFHEG